MFLEGYLPSPSLILLGVPVAAVTVYLWHDWVASGRLTLFVPAVAILVLLIHLVGAGGIGYVSVAQTFWILLALMLGEADPPGDNHPLTRRSAGVLAGAGLAALGVFAQLSYYPQLEAWTLQMEGESLAARRQGQQVVETYHRAALADPLSALGWERLGLLTNAAWLESGDQQLGNLFHTAVREMLAVNDRSCIAHMRAGDWWLAAYRQLDQRNFLDQAVDEYRIATRLYPHYNFGHAQLAWALHLAGDSGGAKAAAEEALRLDSLNPHVEQKLDRQKGLLMDPGGTHDNQPAPPGDRSAEQVMQELRKA
jgi:tetratricopeptide (TPR) repeat protein